MIEFLTDFGWVVWLVLVLVFLVCEMFTLEFTFLMIAVGSVGGLVSGLLGAPFWLQAVIAAVLSLVLIFTIRPPLLRRLKRGSDPTPSNIDALPGMSGSALTDLSTDAIGTVRLINGDTWTARLAPEASGRLASAGSPVVVRRIDGATALVVPTDGRSPLA